MLPVTKPSNSKKNTSLTSFPLKRSTTFGMLTV